jgi:hypothetical protein
VDSGMPPLLDPMVLVPVQRAVSAHLGLPWTGDRLTDLADRSSHRAGVLEGFAFSVFVKLSHAVGAGAQFSAELAGLELIRDRARVLTPTPIGPGVIDVPGGAVLLLEASTAAVGPTSSSSGGFCLGSRGSSTPVTYRSRAPATSSVWWQELPCWLAPNQSPRCCTVTPSRTTS